MRWIVFAGLVGCVPPTLNFNTDATTITASGLEQNQTRVGICAGPAGLLSCNGNVMFSVTVGNDNETPTAGILSFGGQDAYFATNAAETPIIVVESDDFATARANLPSPFDLTGPADLGVYARGTSLMFTWNLHSTDQMSWSATVGCKGTSYFSQSVDIDDTGRLTISTDDLPGADSGTCSASVTLLRKRDGSIDGGYPRGSTIVAQQERSVSFQVSR